MLGLILVTPSFALADIAPEPDWQDNTTIADAEPPADEVTDAQYAPVPTLYGGTDEVTEVQIDNGAGYIEGPSQTAVAWNAFAIVLYITIIVECIAAAIALALMRLPLHSVVAVPVASLVTLPIFWGAAIAGAMGGAITEANWPIVLIIAELLIIFVEAVILHIIHPKAITRRQALIVSAIMNVASVLVGFAIGLN